MKIEMKSVAAVAALGLGLAAGGAAHADGYRNPSRASAYGPPPRATTDYVYARVVDVEPIVRHVTLERPREECRNEVVEERAPSPGVAGPTIAGGVVGAAVGRQFGSGSGRDVMTMIGAMAGAAVANQRAVRNQGYVTREVVVSRCRLVTERYTEERLDGYLVTYVYEGRRHVMRSPTRPAGNRVQLAVDHRPVGYRVRY